MSMKKLRNYVLGCIIFLLASCSNERLEQINPHQTFIASVNILQPSISFYDQSGELFATWSFEKAYTGATLIGFDHVLLYGYQLENVDIVQLSSGRVVRSFEVDLGVTNAYFDEVSNQLFLTNGKTNELTSYTDTGSFINKVKLRNYPMSMISADDRLYVVNYKDTVLSVVHTETLEIMKEWQIPSSSQGLFIAEERQELWIGGHGKGNKPNEFVHIYNMETGQLIKELSLPLMPIVFSQVDEDVVVASHGTNTIYRVTSNGDIIWQEDISANPFAIAQFQEQIVVAGYDDHTLYFIKDGEIQKQVRTNSGPFQLLVRGNTH